MFDSILDIDATVNANLDVDNRLIIPTELLVNLTITSTDVIHSWAVPSLGIKVDAVPGRLATSHLFSFVDGVFYGQCSELCGVLHGFMPICVESVPVDMFFSWAAIQSEYNLFSTFFDAIPPYAYACSLMSLGILFKRRSLFLICIICILVLMLYFFDNVCIFYAETETARKLLDEAIYNINYKIPITVDSTPISKLHGVRDELLLEAKDECELFDQRLFIQKDMLYAEQPGMQTQLSLIYINDSLDESCMAGAKLAEQNGKCTADEVPALYNILRNDVQIIRIMLIHGIKD